MYSLGKYIWNRPWEVEYGLLPKYHWGRESYVHIPGQPSNGSGYIHLKCVLDDNVKICAKELNQTKLSY